jgi:hypothetical protein
MTDYSIPIDTSDHILKTIQCDWKSSDYFHTQVTQFSFRPAAVQKVLLGDQRYVTYMFTWATAPEEISNWIRYQDNSYPGHISPPPPLPEEYKAFLRWLIRPEVDDQGE